MKKKDALKMLATMLAGLNLHPLFLKELKALLEKELRGKESEFFSILSAQLLHIKQFGPLIYTIDSNEKLKGLDKQYYSIHLQRSQFNVRMLIYIKSDGSPFFLCAFYERAGKKQTSYQKYLDALECRLNEMLGDETNEC